MSCPTTGTNRDADKSDRQLRPVRHHVERRIEAHIMVCFLACCLSVTLRKRIEAHATGLTSRAVDPYSILAFIFSPFLVLAFKFQELTPSMNCQ